MIRSDMGTPADIFEDLRELVERESPSDEPDRVSALAAWICERLNHGGTPIARLVPCPPRGDAVVASLGSGVIVAAANFAVLGLLGAALVVVPAWIVVARRGRLVGVGEAGG